MNTVMTKLLDFLTGYIPQVFSRDVDIVRISEYIVFSLSRLHSSTPESAKIKRVNDVLTKFPPSYLEKYGFGRESLLVPVIGVCLNFFNRMPEKALDHLRNVAGYKLSILDTVDEIFAAKESNPKVTHDPQARLKFEAFMKAAREAGEMTESELECDDDYVCPICYRNRINCKYMPCGHTTCKVCAERTMVDNPSCPFCRASVDSLVCSTICLLVSFYLDVVFVFHSFFFCCCCRCLLIQHLLSVCKTFQRYHLRYQNKHRSVQWPVPH